MPLTPFHISVPVTDLASARKFYGEMLGCTEGRSAEQRVDAWHARNRAAERRAPAATPTGPAM
jgi:extradiol dioxygenase family protein